MQCLSKRALALCMVASMSSLVATTRAANVLIDPGFEGQVTSPTNNGVGGWSLFNGAAFSTDVARTGTHSMKDFTVNNVPGSFETFPAAAGQKWELTGFGLTPAALTGNPGFGIVQLTFFSGVDGTGTNLGTVETGAGNALASAQVSAASPLNTWIPLDTGVGTAPAGAQSVQAFTLVVDFNGPANGEGVYFDDLSFSQTPEPASLGLLAVGGLLGLRRRSRA